MNDTPEHTWDSSSITKYNETLSQVLKVKIIDKIDFQPKIDISFSEDSREIVDTINRTLITIFIFWVIHQVIEPISYILSGLNKILTRELIGWIIKSLKILFLHRMYSYNIIRYVLNFCICISTYTFC